MFYNYFFKQHFMFVSEIHYLN